MKRKFAITTVLLLMMITVTSVGLAMNPIISNVFTADPAAMVYNGTVYLYTGHDEAALGGSSYVMNNWLCFSSTDMVNWTSRGTALSVSAFSWAKADAWAGQVIYRNGKFYWYICAEHKTISGKAIGVAVSTSPTGPFTDARGSALITNNQTTQTSISWDDIDPTVFIDDDGQAYLYWGNTVCKYVKLNSDMITYSGSIQTVSLPSFTEAPWLHKHNGIYYLSYAYGWPEKIAYATSSSPTGPWTYRGIINDYVPNCGTNHQAIIEFNGNSYFIYHNGLLGGDYRRSVCIDRLYYNSDGTIQQVVQTTAGLGSTVPKTGVNYLIINRNSSKFLDVINASTADGANVQQYSNTVNNCQRWKLVDAGSGYYQIVNVNSGKLLEVVNASTADGGNVQQYTNNGNNCQKWRLEDAGGGFYRIINVNSGKLLEVISASTADGANVQQYTNNGNYCQQWRFIQ